MKKYTAIVNIKGQSVRTAIFADNIIHAKLILQYQFGISSVLAGPSLAETKANPK